MNQIIEKQNMEKNLKIQYGARTYYNTAEVLCIMAWIVSIISIIMDVYVSDKLTIKIIVIATCAILTVILQTGVEKFTHYAAAFRMFFDYEMFGWSSETFHDLTKEEIFEKAELIIKIRKKDSLIRLHNTGREKPRGVKEWYDNIENLKDGNNLINECQQQNMWWTRNISKVQNYFFGILFVLILLVLVIKFFNSSVSQLVIFLLCWTTLFINLGIEFNRNIRQKELLKCFERHNKYANSHQNISEDYLKEMQEIIDERRMLPAIVLNIIHDKGSSFFHMMYRSRKNN